LRGRLIGRYESFQRQLGERDVHGRAEHRRGAQHRHHGVSQREFHGNGDIARNDVVRCHIVTGIATQLLVERHQCRVVGGIDLSAQSSKSLNDISGDFDAVVTMGCGDSCPWVPAKRREDWNLSDPKNMDDVGYRTVRDEIAARVKHLLAEL